MNKQYKDIYTYLKLQLIFIGSWYRVIYQNVNSRND